MNTASHLLAIHLLLSTLILRPAIAETQQTNSLESLRQSFQKQEQSFQEAYGKDLTRLMVDLKKQENLDAYLIVEAEKKRFDSEKTGPHASSNAVLKSPSDNYYKARIGILRKYVLSLENLVKAEMRADRMENAKEAKAEKVKIEHELDNLVSKQSKVPSPQESIVGLWTYSANKSKFTAQIEVRENGIVIWKNTDNSRVTKYWTPISDNAYLISDKKGIQGFKGWVIIHLPIVNGVATCDDWNGGFNSCRTFLA
jgi:hypothetical protein